MKTTTKKLVFAFSFMLVMITALFMMKAEAAGETYTLKGVSASGTGIDSSLKIANLSISRKWNAVPPSHTFEPISTVLYKDVNLRKEYTGTAPIYGSTYYVGIGVKNLVAGDHSIGISDDNTSVRNLTVPGYYTEYVRTIT
ncbi:MAG: hypothetical protein J6H18_04515, partial [Lachnospiraceae bacterium]|nr:hypothetical protein [Lachnospiraceae bacterium]